MLKKVQYLQGVDMFGALAASASTRRAASKRPQDPLEAYLAEMQAAMAAEAEAEADAMTRRVPLPDAPAMRAA